MDDRVLMLMIEPTPYISGFISALRNQWPGAIDDLFVAANVSQSWENDHDSSHVLSGRILDDLRTFLKSLTPGRYALVHVAGWSNPRIFAAMLICWFRGIPVAVESDTAIRPQRLNFRSVLKGLLYPWLFRIPQIFFPGGTLQANYLQYYAVPEGRLQIAGMTVDVEAMMAYMDGSSVEQRTAVRRRFGWRDPGVLFLYVGRLETHKGVRVLLDAYRRLKGQSNTASNLLIVGDGELYGELRDAATQLDNVIVAGRLQGADLYNAYLAADVFVLPSLSEPWGLVINEAMAFALPVIVTDAVGCRADLVKEGENGLIVRAGDSLALAETMKLVCEDPGLRARMAVASRRVIKPWTLASEAGRVIDGWQRVIHR